jgi:hypothetical protein
MGEQRKKRPCPECGADLEHEERNFYYCATCDDHVECEGLEDDEDDDGEEAAVW